jgi:hypothetical protein
MLILLWQAWQYNRGGGDAGGDDGKSERSRYFQKRIIDDPRFDLHAIEEEVIVATVTAFVRIQSCLD